MRVKFLNSKIKKSYLIEYIFSDNQKKLIANNCSS